MSVEFTQLLAKITRTFQPMIKFNRAIYIRDPVVCLVLTWVTRHPQQTIRASH